MAIGLRKGGSGKEARGTIVHCQPRSNGHEFPTTVNKENRDVCLAMMFATCDDRCRGGAFKLRNRYLRHFPKLIRHTRTVHERRLQRRCHIAYCLHCRDQIQGRQRFVRCTSLRLRQHYCSSPRALVYMLAVTPDTQRIALRTPAAGGDASGVSGGERVTETKLIHLDSFPSDLLIAY